MDNDQLKVPIFIPMIIGIIAISFSSIFIKWSDSPVSVQGMYRLLFTLFLMLPFIWKYRSIIKKLSAQELFYLMLSGIFLALHFLFWMGSLKLTSVASSTILLSLQPICVMVGAYFAFKEKTSFPALLSMIISVIGAIIIGWGDIGISTENIKGDVLSVAGTIVVAIHMLIGQKLLKTIPASVYSFFAFLFAVVTLFLYNLILKVPMTGYPNKEWGIFWLLAFVPTVFGHVLFNWLLRYVTASTISMAILGEPVGASILAFLILHEQMKIAQWVGGVIVLLGLYFFLQNTRKQKKDKPPAPLKQPITTGPIVKKHNSL